MSVLAVDPGFRSENLLTLQIALPNSYVTADQRRTLYTTLFTKLDALPGVAASGGTTRLPLGSTNVTTKIDVEGRNLPPGEWPEVEFRRAVHNYFAAMGIPILRGRGFDATDGPDDAAGRRHQPDDGAPTLRQRGSRWTAHSDRLPGSAAAPTPWSTIVGVIGDVRHSGLEATPSPEMYMPSVQGPPSNPFIVVRTAGDPAALATSVRTAVQEVDRTIAVYDIRTMAQVRSESVSQRRFVLILVGAFGMLALLMAAVGVYGVMALVVSERTPEIGIRLALGAQPGGVLRLVVGQGIMLAAAGIVIGVAAAAALAPLLGTQLYGVGTLDPPTLFGVPALLLSIAIIACWLPARRAMKIDPVNALRV